MFVPSAQYPSDDKMAEFRKVAGDIRVIDYNEQTMFDTVGIDMQTDYFDFLHFNIRGARKFSSVLADLLAQTVDIPRHAHSEQLWSERSEYESSLAE